MLMGIPTLLVGLAQFSFGDTVHSTSGIPGEAY